jgi:hypothetical protein
MKCPNQEKLFEFVSIPAEMPKLERVRLQWHTKACAHCQEEMTGIRATWEGYFTPEPDITASLMSVYSRLQSDETLILKGWKLSEFRAARASSVPSTGWAWRAGMAIAASIVLVFVGITGGILPGFGPSQDAMMTAAVAPANEKLPFAQIRVEDKDNNRVQVHYLQPELLQSVEFETTSTR